MVPPKNVLAGLLRRMLALAYREVPAAELPEQGPMCGGEEADVAGLERELVLAALVGIEDPLRREVPAAIAQCQRAGITVRMLTGGASAHPPPSLPPSLVRSCVWSVAERRPPATGSTVCNSHTWAVFNMGVCFMSPICRRQRGDGGLDRAPVRHPAA